MARVAVAAAILLSPVEALARVWYVAPGGAGNGTEQAPFGIVQTALGAAQPGDTILLRAGTYREAIRTVRSGLSGAPVTLKGESGRGPVVITTSGTVLHIVHSFITVENLVIDAAYASRTAARIGAGTQSVVLRRLEIRRSGRDCVDIGAARDVLVEDALIHHCLNAAGGRTDAHGLVAGAVQRLTVRGTEIHTFSGDAIQLNRTGTSGAEGWNDVLIERCRFWLAPLASAENGFPEGAVTGENAIDTKVAGTSSRARITIRDTQAWGFRGGLIRVQAAFNLKENIDAVVDRVTVWNSEIAFRLRGSDANTSGAWVRIQNAVLYDVGTGIRYEDDIQRLRVWNTTFGRHIARAFEDVSSAGHAKPDVRNVVFVGNLPPEARDGSNLAASQNAFVDASSDDYRLRAESALVDAGVAIAEVEVDRVGVNRPQRRALDVGAYEIK
jgi:hypothetical protein